MVKKLRIFDFDDTLAKTKGQVTVKKQDGTILRLNTQEYVQYKKQPGDQCDYSEFECLISPEENKWVTNILKSVVEKNGLNSAVILTARGNVEPIEEFLKIFNLPRIPIVALGDSHPERKQQWILYVGKKFNYDIIEFFDDNPHYIEAVKKIKNKLPKTQIITKQIKV